jgi:hypothetical protein
MKEAVNMSGLGRRTVYSNFLSSTSRMKSPISSVGSISSPNAFSSTSSGTART